MKDKYRDDSGMVTGAGVERFLRLFVASYLGKNFADGTPADIKDDICGLMFALGAAKGVRDFMVEVTERGTSAAIRRYSEETSSMMQAIQWSTQESIAMGGADRADEALGEYLTDIGVEPVQPDRLRVLGVLMEKAGLGNGVDGECNCPACRLRRVVDEETSGVERKFFVRCPRHGRVQLPGEVYVQQMLAGNRWTCPMCGAEAELCEEDE